MQSGKTEQLKIQMLQETVGVNYRHKFIKSQMNLLLILVTDLKSYTSFKKKMIQQRNNSGKNIYRLPVSVLTNYLCKQLFYVNKTTANHNMRVILMVQT